MFGKKVKLFKLFDFQVQFDISWIFIALLITWSLAAGYFPYYYRNLSPMAYLWMGIFGALGLFLSIIIHEMSHSLIARKFGLPIQGITLFVFGGVSEMQEEPATAKAEFFMAIAGPIASFILAGVFYFIFRVGDIFNVPFYVSGVFRYLGWINLILAVFNLVPAFPLDGGRVLRSILWNWKKDMYWATRVSSQLGSGFGFFLSFVGVLYFFSGAVVSGIWFILIGLFLHGAARLSYQKLLMTGALQGETVRHFMKRDIVSVPDSISIQSLVENYFYKYHYKFFPVVNNEKLVGCINIQDVKEIPREEWPRTSVSQILKSCGSKNTVTPNTDAKQALSMMNNINQSRFLVVEKEKLVGIITLKDLMKFISIKMELEGGKADSNK